MFGTAAVWTSVARGGSFQGMTGPGGPTASHVDDAKLNALLDGELDDGAAAAVRSHIAGCAECGRRLEDARRFLAESADVLGETAPPPDAVLAAGKAGPAAGPEGPARRTSATAKEAAVDLDGATQQSPAIRPAEEPVPLFRGRAPQRRLDATSLAWAATIVLAVAVGFLGNEVLHARATVRAGAGHPAAPSAAGASTEVARPAAPPAATAAQGLPAVKTLNPRGPSVLGRKRLDGRAAARVDSAPAPGLRRGSLLEAANRLGGTIRLIDGLRGTTVAMGPGSLVPGARRDRDVVRISYQYAGRQVTLDEQRVGAPPTPPPAGTARDAAAAGGLADTTFTTAPDGANTMRWLDEHGFWLALTARLPPDSLRRLAARVR